MAKLEALLHNIIVQLASHLNMLFTKELSFKSKSFQQRLICVFGAYIQVVLIEFFEGSILSKAGNISNIL